ncbi:hypothetical protein BKA69DRAFT_468303 [Paraphysoderma sedebokerense]|nr:hypothetical protein BKA69DRAFT_468303 [Paraphysoderma sedebokerense]
MLSQETDNTNSSPRPDDSTQNSAPSEEVVPSNMDVTSTLLQQIYAQVLQQPLDNNFQSLSTALTLAQMQTTSPHSSNPTVPNLSNPVPYCEQSTPAPPVLGAPATEPLITQPSTSVTHTTLEPNVTQTEADGDLNDILKSAIRKWIDSDSDRCSQGVRQGNKAQHCGCPK